MNVIEILANIKFLISHLCALWVLIGLAIGISIWLILINQKKSK
jgi:hypothetical protein